NPAELGKESPPLPLILLGRVAACLSVVLYLVPQEVAEPHFPGAEPLAERHHVTERIRRGEQRAERRPLAFLDALGDLHLALTRGGGHRTPPPAGYAERTGAPPHV